LNVTLPITIDDDLTVDGDLVVTGNTTLGNAIGDTVTTSGPVTVGGALQVNGNTTLGNAIGDTTTVAGPATFDSTATITGTLTCNGNITLGNASSDALAVVATVTVQNEATFDDLVTCSADVILGSADTDSLIVVSTTTFQSPININDTVDFGANTITGTGGTLTTNTLNIDTIQYSNSGVVPATNGLSVYDSRTLTLGDGTTARRVHTPVEAYAVSHTTALAVADITGASITMDIETSEWVKVRLSAAHLLAGGDTFSILIAATNGVDVVTVLNSGDADAASYGFTFGAAQKITQSITVRWRPINDVAVPNNTTWTLRARHGVSGGNNLTSSNVELQAWYD
jgi:hypothetical protein